MTVRDLIIELQEYDADALVYCASMSDDDWRDPRPQLSDDGSGSVLI